MCVFVSCPVKIVIRLLKNDYTPKRVVDFPRERDTFRNKIMEIVEDFDEKRYNNNGKPWKSSMIFCVKSNFFHFSFFFHHFSPCFHFWFFFFKNFFIFSFFRSKKISFFHFFIFCLFFIFSSFFHFFHSFSFIFFFFL